MKILCFTDCLGPGGAQRQLVGLAALLKKDGNEVTVMTYYDVPFYFSFLVQNGISHILMPNMIFKFLRIYELLKYVYKEKPEVIVAYQTHSAVIACLVKILYPKFKLLVSERNTTQKYGIREWIYFSLYRWADYIIPNSYSQERFIDKHVPKLMGKVHTITNFVDIDMYMPNSEKRKNNDNILKIVTIGRITEQKNVLRYLDALAKVRDKGILIKVFWYGVRQGEEYYKLCLKRIEELRLQDIFSLNQETSDVLEVYHNADVFCLPSIYEGFPNVICEAMSCGLPILCGDICDNGTLVSSNYNGLLFNPFDVDNMYGTIVKYAQLSIEQKEKMAINSRKRAMEKLSAESFKIKYKTLIGY